MSIRVYGAGQNPTTDRFLYRCSGSSGAHVIASGRGRAIVDGEGRPALQLIEGAPTCDAADAAVSIGRNAVLAFARVQNPMIAPQKLHYEIPMAGDRTCFARHRRRLIHVSSRSLFSRQILTIAKAQRCHTE